MQKKKILFVGAGGGVAGILLPLAAKEYDIVGIAGKRRDLKPYCVELYSCNLFAEYTEMFEQVFSTHQFDAVVWNPVRSYSGPLLASSRESLHAEFDLAVALPLECLKIALKYFFGPEATFVIMTSGLAFETKNNWGSYSIVKRSQVILADYLATELASQSIHPKAIALGRVPRLESKNMYEAFTHAIENKDPSKILYRVYTTPWE